MSLLLDNRQVNLQVSIYIVTMTTSVISLNYLTQTLKFFLFKFLSWFCNNVSMSACLCQLFDDNNLNNILSVCQTLSQMHCLRCSEKYSAMRLKADDTLYLIVEGKRWNCEKIIYYRLPVLLF